ncbi:MAG TPA: archaetidylserine decarboxylase [Stellaceae bacterium]|jgi:phosphatidylserine decarboxylase|nr:archaetidylserine decarboxylase [Stellaceae bacterium]
MTVAWRPNGLESLRESLNFLLSNRIPRRFATRLMGWFSHIESPFLARISIAIWRRFSDLDLADARIDRFSSLHACFTRELKPGARPIDDDPRVMTSPCDGIVIACGPIEEGRLMQVKGSSYRLGDLVMNPELVGRYRGGQYVTLRLTPSMYHRFHAPYDCTVEHVSYIPGDTWNVNPPALKRIPGLYCRNERAVIRLVLEGSKEIVTLVAVAAILVAGIRLRFLDLLMNSFNRGAIELPCHASLGKGEEMGWFEHGSTIIMLAPRGASLAAGICEGVKIRLGRPLMQLQPISRGE